MVADESNYGWNGRFERLHFKVAWTVVPAGRAVIQARQPEPDRARFKIKACTNQALDVFHKVRDKILARTRLTGDGLRAHSYRIIRREGDDREKKALRFGDGGLVHTKDLRTGKTDYFPVESATVDVLTALYATRRRALEDGQKIRIPVFDDEQSYDLVVDVVGRERLDTVFGEDTPTVKVRPRLKTDGVFSRKGKLWVWFTDDRRHIPVRMESEIAIGSVTARLTALHRAAGQDKPGACR
ncbi:DUF3108 domain-containing protein [Thiohalorhabdus methylotrophus]|uniref:DUF3108 domain-containing protein n=1 Tax=Thiohalorhabdus methylotrophus TaxID=3242694 RepID=A0ABV4TXS9_9GAMM